MTIAVAIGAGGDRHVRASVKGMRMRLATVTEPVALRAPPEPWPTGLMRMSVVRAPETVADVSDLLDYSHVRPLARRLSR
jgi:hypothetical protein